VRFLLRAARIYWPKGGVTFVSTTDNTLSAEELSKLVNDLPKILYDLMVEEGYLFATKEEFEKYVQGETVSTSEAAQVLNCSILDLNILEKRGIIKPIKEMHQDKLFWKSDILARLKPSE
jgi:hypothetical protein